MRTEENPKYVSLPFNFVTENFWMNSFFSSVNEIIEHENLEKIMKITFGMPLKCGMRKKTKMYSGRREI